MLKATIDRNENACHIELMGSSLELSNDLCLLIENFTSSLMTKHSKKEAQEFVMATCMVGIANALEESK